MGFHRVLNIKIGVSVTKKRFQLKNKKNKKIEKVVFGFLNFGYDICEVILTVKHSKTNGEGGDKSNMEGGGTDL
jgi:hypothetical protein